MSIFSFKKMSILFLLIGIVLTQNAFAKSRNEIFISKDAFVSFFSAAPIADITAKTDHAVSAINLSNGEVFFKVPMKTFRFERSLMQQHFNTEYLETDKYPFATFKGKIQNFTPPTTDGKIQVTVKGEITLHGITKSYTAKGYLEIKNGALKSAGSKFNIHLADYNIKAPSVLNHNMAEVLAIQVNATYHLYQK